MEKGDNIRAMRDFVLRAANAGAQVVVLPEMWNCPYENKYFRPYAEPEGGESFSALSAAAREGGVWLFGGSVPELGTDGSLYNTCYIFDSEGGLRGRHRKMHLFDIDIEGGVRFRESDTLTAGDSLTVVDTPYGKIGAAICFDVRFAGMFSQMAAAGAELIVIPANFTVPTGTAHWNLLMRARALDNQLYVAACSQARTEDGVYQAYAHSCVTTPWGEITAQAEEPEEIITTTIDRNYIRKVRREIPIT
jgi:predicted amidohydrolase